jgi:hypothetical protein
MWNNQASYQQIGWAAGNRDNYSGPQRQQLNYVVHSGDSNPHRHGRNPYADASHTYSQPVQNMFNSLQQNRRR